MVHLLFKISFLDDKLLSVRRAVFLKSKKVCRHKHIMGWVKEGSVSCVQWLPWVGWIIYSSSRAEGEDLDETRDFVVFSMVETTWINDDWKKSWVRWGEEIRRRKWKLRWWERSIEGEGEKTDWTDWRKSIMKLVMMRRKTDERAKIDRYRERMMERWKRTQNKYIGEL